MKKFTEEEVVKSFMEELNTHFAYYQSLPRHSHERPLVCGVIAGIEYMIAKLGLANNKEILAKTTEIQNAVIDDITQVVSQSGPVLRNIPRNEVN